VVSNLHVEGDCAAVQIPKTRSQKLAVKHSAWKKLVLLVSVKQPQSYAGRTEYFLR
jgi:hypothetical protein